MMEQEDIPPNKSPTQAPIPIMSIDKGFLEGVLCLLRRALCGSGGFLRRFFGLADLLCVVPLDTLLLQKTGDRIGGGQGRIVMERLLVKKLRVCLDGGIFRLDRIPPGLHAVLPDSGADTAHSMSGAALRQFLALMPSLHTHIFMFHLADLPVGGGREFLYRAGKRIVPQMAVRLFLHILKAEAGLAFACRLVKDALGL